MMLAGVPPWIPYLAQALRGSARAVPKNQGPNPVRFNRTRPAGTPGPRAGKMTKEAFLRDGGVYGGGTVGGIPSLAPKAGPAIAPGFDLL